MDAKRTRSTRNSPVSLSSSYLVLAPRGISMTAGNSPGLPLGNGMSCQGWAMGSHIAPEARHGKSEWLREGGAPDSPAPPTFSAAPARHVYSLAVRRSLVLALWVVGCSSKPDATYVGVLPRDSGAGDDA